MSVVLGGPDQNKPEPDERPGFFVHKNLTCYLDTQPDGVYVEGKDKSGTLHFRVHKGNVAEALSYIEHLKENEADESEAGTGKSDSRGQGKS